ncbi:MAG: hypothetical protein ACOC56_01855 [Atribacterota bacterium]
MKKTLFMIGVAILFVGCASFPKHQEIQNANVGPYPENYKKIVKSYFNEVLIDSPSARYEWVQEPYKGCMPKMMYVGNVDYGYIVIVKVNAKNRMGGYTGKTPYALLIRNGKVINKSKYGEEASFGTPGWSKSYTSPNGEVIE